MSGKTTSAWNAPICRFFIKLKTDSIDGIDCGSAMLDASLEAIVRQDLGNR